MRKTKKVLQFLPSSITSTGDKDYIGRGLKQHWYPFSDISQQKGLLDLATGALRGLDHQNRFFVGGDVTKYDLFHIRAHEFTKMADRKPGWDGHPIPAIRPKNLRNFRFGLQRVSTVDVHGVSKIKREFVDEGVGVSKIKREFVDEGVGVSTIKREFLDEGVSSENSWTKG